MNCANCGKELHPVEGASAPQYDNALAIEFSGGYGMFIDPMTADPIYAVMLCHECAHGLCEATPWIGKLLDPLNSHSHAWTLPGHKGWDLPHAGMP